MGAFSTVLVAAIVLQGVTGSELRARAFFDANNVKVGDPLVLTVDFLGEADFTSLHPPLLSRAVSRTDWKLDDASAKTDTFRDARRLTYRVRPMREGVLWFPALEFEYAGKDGVRRTVRANEIPVHARGGAQVVVEEMSEDVSKLPSPPELVRTVSCPLTDDARFRWRKALSRPTAEAFAEFDFPEARLNEATCALRAGNWTRALRIYTRLEWRIGQTPEIEKGIRAALALKHDNPEVELPVWRQILRPILRFSWIGRVGLVAGGFSLLFLLVWLLGHGIRAVACLLLVVGLSPSVRAQGLFQQMEEQMHRMQQQMQQSFGSFGGGLSAFGRREPARVTATVTTDRKDLQVGAPFEFIISLDFPRTASVGQVRIAPSESFGLTFTGPAQNLTDGVSPNPSNVVKRIALLARYDVPYKGRVLFSVEGMVTGRQTHRGGVFTMSFSDSFRCQTQPLAIGVRPLPSSGQPADFAGVISQGLRIHETCDRLTVGTNDVVTITYRLFPRGFVPEGFLPPGAAFEWVRQNDGSGRVSEIEYRRFFVADGAKATPRIRVPYYDPRTKSYKTAETGGTSLVYRSEEGL